MVHPSFTSGAEDGDEGWVLDGFTSTTGTETGDFANYYIASHRSFVSFDKYLKTGPYNFGFANTKPDFVEHFSYTPGLLVSYWDTSQGDNNTSEHPGQGLILPIDSHPKALYNLTGAPWRSRIQVLRRPVLGQRSQVVHAPRERPGELHPGPGRPAGVRRQPVVPGPGHPVRRGGRA